MRKLICVGLRQLYFLNWSIEKKHCSSKVSKTCFQQPVRVMDYNGCSHTPVIHLSLWLTPRAVILSRRVIARMTLFLIWTIVKSVLCFTFLPTCQTGQMTSPFNIPARRSRLPPLLPYRDATVVGSICVFEKTSPCNAVIWTLIPDINHQTYDLALMSMRQPGSV